MILILVIAYVFIGPEDLPKVARWLGRVVRRIRGLIREIKSESGWEEFVSEAQSVRKEINDTITENKDAVTKTLREVQNEFSDVNKELDKNINEAKKDTLG